MMVDHGAQVVSDRVRLTQATCDAHVLGVGFLPGVAGAVAVLANGSALAGAAPDLVRGAGSPIPLGAVAISARPDADGRAMLVGMEDGRLLRVAPTGGVEALWAGDPGWVEQIATHAPSGSRAISQGRAVRVLDAEGRERAVLADHPSTPAGIAFSPDGREVAVAHYGGATVWSVATGTRAHALSWHGSHTGIAWSPDGRFIVTAMQDKELHGWRMPAAKGMRMSGYPAKIRSLSWTADSAFLVAGGADTVTSWYCADGGPAGRAPLEFGYVFNGFVARVAAHPAARRAAAGYNEGTVLIGEIETGDAIIARPPGGGAVTSIAWSQDGGALLVGTEQGALALIEVTDPATV